MEKVIIGSTSSESFLKSFVRFTIIRFRLLPPLITTTRQIYSRDSKIRNAKFRKSITIDDTVPSARNIYFDDTKFQQYFSQGK